MCGLSIIRFCNLVLIPPFGVFCIDLSVIYSLIAINNQKANEILRKILKIPFLEFTVNNENSLPPEMSLSFLFP